MPILKFGPIDLVATPLHALVMSVNEKQVKSEHIVEQSELIAIIDQSKSAPHPDNLFTEKRFLNSRLVLMRPNSKIHVLRMRYNTTISVPPFKKHTHN